MDRNQATESEPIKDLIAIEATNVSRHSSGVDAPASAAAKAAVAATLHQEQGLLKALAADQQHRNLPKVDLIAAAHKLRDAAGPYKLSCVDNLSELAPQSALTLGEEGRRLPANVRPSVLQVSVTGISPFKNLEDAVDDQASSPSTALLC